MYDLYECVPILRLPSDVRIDACVSGESGDGLTLAMYCSNSCILCYHTSQPSTPDTRTKAHTNDVIIREIEVDDSRGEVRSMCFNESGSQLIAVFANSSFVVIPISTVIATPIADSLDYDLQTIESCSLVSPTAVLWWTSLDRSRDIAIVGNELGEIGFVDIKTKCEIGGTYVQNPVKSLRIFKDRFGVSLVIGCQNETQWRLTLERTRGVHVEPDFATNTQYFPCFITNSDDREAIGPNNCWNTKPVLINMTDNQTIPETDIISTSIVYQNPYILSISNTACDGHEFGQIVLRVIPDNDFNYTFASFLAKYFIPKVSSLDVNDIILTERLFFVTTEIGFLIVSREYADARKLAKLNSIVQEIKFDIEKVMHMFRLPNTNSAQLLDSFVIITSNVVYECRPKQSCQQIFTSLLTSPSLANASDAFITIKSQRFASMLGLNLNGLYEKTADLCLERSQFAAAVRYYQLAKTSQMKRIANFVSYGYLSEVIAYIEILFSSRVYELEDQDKMHFANIALNCLVQKLLDNKIKNNEHNAENTLKVFLKVNLFYDESVALRLLVEQGLYEIAEYCAKLRAQYSLLLSYLIKSSYIRAKALTQSVYDSVSHSDYKDLVLDNCQHFSYLNCITSKEVTYSLILRRDTISNYLRFAVKLLPNLSMTYLIKLAIIFDPRRSATQLLLNRVLSHYKQSYLNCDDSDEQFIQKKDVLNLFIFVTLMIIRQSGSLNVFDEKYITIEPYMNDISANKKRLIIETVEVSAGQFHSAYILNGCLYLWGKSQFGCLGLLTDDTTNIPKMVCNPTRLTLFKDILSLSVKAVSCGSQHTLVLTDFGVYSFGSSRFGQLGLGSDVILARSPVIINDFVNIEIIKIECGHFHSFAITSEGVLYSWGWGLHGQLGNGSIEDAFVPTVVKFSHRVKVIQVCGGYGHSIALDSNGGVYSFGNGTYGQLGLDTNAKHSLPQKIALLSEPICKISTKYFHCLALSCNNQNLFIWGANPQTIRLQSHNSRKLRLNQAQPIVPFIANQDHLRPIILDTSAIKSQIVKICAGNTHSLILTSDGEVFSFGRGIDGQLGHGRVKEVKIPSKITTMNDINIVNIAAGCDFSLAIDINGCIWGWGLNSDCQIGSKAYAAQHNSSTFEDNKKISIRTNRRMITLVPGSKVVEHLPVKINIIEEVESYCDSLNYSLDINAMKASTFRPVIKEMNILSEKDCAVFDYQVLVTTLVYYHNELDLNCVLNRCLNFKCLQIAAFVCELKKDYSKALEYQLQALKTSANLNELDFDSLCIRILHVFANKVLDNLQLISKIISVFIKFWIENDLHSQRLEAIMEKCYKNHIKDSMFGISFFSYLNEDLNEKNKFSPSFLLEMVNFTIKTMAVKPEKLFAYQTAIEKITTNIDNVSFPAETLWQDILSHFQCMTISNSQSPNGIEIAPNEDEIILFKCSHYYGANEFKLNILPDFKKDINEMNGIALNEMENLLSIYNSFTREIWNNSCPKCILSDFKSKSEN